MKSNIKFYKNKLSLFLSALFLIQLVLFNTNNIVFAATTPSVSYTVTGETKIGNTIEIAVNVSNISDLYAGSIDFVYDTNLLEIQSITKGNIFGNNEVLTPIGANGKIENGQASFAITMKGNKDGISSDNGTIAVIKAKILKEGTVKLNTTSSNTESLNLTGNTIRVKLADSNGSNISYNFTNKNIALENNISLDLTADKDTCNLGESITFTASSNLGSNAQYAFY
ncbi:cohesin domain-containing protein, partial [Clostridium nigeriense]|uniref:cohesin domain-containing protein n=1 Tax=Clostridium nigeriense TaxID=1805470 RepID=UPI003D352FD4